MSKQYSEMATEISGDVIVIGDVHGYLDSVKDLFRQFEENIPDFENTWVVFLGDYSDRGPNSKETLEFLVDLWKNRPKTTFLMGNHDLAFSLFLGLLELPKNYDYEPHKSHLKTREKKVEIPQTDNMPLQGLRYPIAYSAQNTFISYGAKFGNNNELNEIVSEDVKQFYRSLPWIINHPKYNFVHGGFSKEMTYEENVEQLEKKDLTLIRPVWLCERNLKDAPKDAKKTIVSGHVSYPEVQFLTNRILVDTTGGYNKFVSAVHLPTNKVFRAFPDEEKN
ncbi:tyrosine-protein phosphatase rlph2 [Anaeramoeba flamelloides]|uniref:Tyrosine-protein phosphatase rlph2 n=1 Tax=Anaeramoeba flamelloides TaxID=1746091 RepID=A0AAV7ZKP2_9EUKA|nr:tyrosine-protein phosphatase rlph2 [Anaeramoeba flamelloides]KAJ6242289.1 tyrosine-protein phosphatase rlph2 [Anaeramoeba flamelloides]